jgi:hypothetical protein
MRLCSVVDRQEARVERIPSTRRLRSGVNEERVNGEGARGYPLAAPKAWAI